VTENPLAKDLDHILDHTRELWEELRGGRIFVTGGTGFFGSWWLESFAWANDRLSLDASAVVLTRNPDAFRRNAPSIAGHPAIACHKGNMQSFEFPNGAFSHVIHAATEAPSATGQVDAIRQFDVNVQGTRRVLDFAIAGGVRRFLFISSGAVYGPQPADIPRVGEHYAGAPASTDPGSAYAQSKRVSEFMCAVYAQRHGLQVAIARCFAFVGPWLPLDRNYAVGNFIRDALRGGPIRVMGDGTPYRSYLYASDLAVWLWTILFRGRSGGAYNVGEEREITVADLAREVAAVVHPHASVEVLQRPAPGQPVERYVPSTERAREELGLEAWTRLDEAIRRTAEFYRR
jgi:dTDP-glucose 4,6-dehydratase